MNVLLSSAGRRVGLLRCFCESLEELSLEGRVCAADCSATAPVFHIADRARLAPRCTAADFTEKMLAIAREESIRLIVPTIDTELPVFSAMRSRFADNGVTVCVSEEETVAICADKARTHAWLTSHGFPTVAQSNLEEALESIGDWRFPAIVKPRNGSASAGVRKIRTRLELESLEGTEVPLIVQELAPGDEYTVNVYVDRQERCRCAVPHRRLEVRAGEVAKGVTVKHTGMMNLAREIAEALPGAFGALNIQCFLADDGAIRIIEINARFGGGYPLAHQAGAHFASWLIEEALGHPTTASFDGWEDDLAMLRYDEAVYLPGARIREGSQDAALHRDGRR